MVKPPREEDFLRPIKLWEKITIKFPNFFYNNPDLYYFIADCYRHLGMYKKAIEYYRKVVGDFPHSEISASAQFRIWKEYRKLRDTGLIEHSEAYKHVNQAYEELVAKYPNSRYAIFARMWKQNECVNSYVNSGDILSADNALDKLINDFANSERLPQIISSIARKYYDKGIQYQLPEYLEKALEKWKLVLRKYPASHHAAGACYYVGICYNHLGEYEMAEEYFQKVARDYPNYQYKTAGRCLNCP